MTFVDYARAKNQARQRLGRGTLICSLSAKDLEEIQKDATELGENKMPHDTESVPAALHQDVIFKVREGKGLRFSILETGGPVYTD